MEASSDDTRPAAPHDAAAPTLAALLARIDRLADDGNLAAVLVHVNDTYVADAQPPRLPGLARVAGLVAAVRARVAERLGADLTFASHGGDYLGPSRLGRRTHGAHMTALLRHCGLDAATIGNHEFDHGPAALAERLVESRAAPQDGARPFASVLSNLLPPADFAGPIDTVLTWPAPPARPLLAVIGLAGEQTIGVARAHRFVERPLDAVFAALDATLAAQPSVLGLVVLTHGGRDEDRRLQRAIGRRFPRCAVFVLGGHDHHMGWAERLLTSVLLKCPSNARTVAVLAVPRDALAAIRLGGPWEGLREPAGPWSAAERALVAGGVAIAPAERRRLRRVVASSSTARLLRHPAAVLRRTRAAVEAECAGRHAGGLDAPTREAFHRTMARTLADQLRFLRGSARSELNADLVSLAVAHARAGLHAELHHVAVAALPDVPADPRAEATAARWRGAAGTADAEVVVDVSAHTDTLDALDTSVRAVGTDLGNLLADAVQAATGAAVALLNAGSLRADATLSPRLTVGQLRELLLYDGPQAGIVLTLPRGGLRRLVAHARAMGHHGAFLQVSAGLAAALDGPDDTPLRVAMVRHMLAAPSDEDGYCAALAQDGESPAALRARLLAAVESSGSLEAWVRAGASRVAYARAPRLVSDALLADAATDVRRWLDRVDAYRAACTTAGLRPPLLVGHDADPGLPDAVRAALEALVAFLRDGHRLGRPAKDAWFQRLYVAARDHEANYRAGPLPSEGRAVCYDLYLDRVVDVLGSRLGTMMVFGPDPEAARPPRGAGGA